jgi:hypothetical protein
MPLDRLLRHSVHLPFSHITPYTIHLLIFTCNAAQAVTIRSFIWGMPGSIIVHKTDHNYWVSLSLQVHTGTTIRSLVSLISGFRRDADEICALLGYYAASCGNCLPTFRSHLHGSRAREDGTDTLSRNVGKQLPHELTPRSFLRS